MIKTKISDVYGVVFCSSEEIAKYENGNEVLKECSGRNMIPVRLLRLLNDHKGGVYFMYVAGEGALHPWKRGDEVETSFAKAFISKLFYLQEMSINNIDNSKYQNFCLYDTIIPVISGNSFPEKDAKRYKGLFSYDLFKDLADDYYKEDYSEDWSFV